MRSTPGATPAPARLALRAGLVRLLERKPLAAVTVRELASESFVSRSTFYAHCSSIDELLAEIEDLHVTALDELNEEIANPKAAGEERLGFYSRTLDYADAHLADFRALLSASPNARFAEKWKGAVRSHLRRRRLAAARPALSALTEEVAASAVIAACAFYVSHPGEVARRDAIGVVAKALAVLDA